MELCCTYIETEHFDKVVEFYEKIFQTKGKIYTINRWVEFDFGNKLSIYNKLYNENLLKSKSTKMNFNESYVKEFNKINKKSFNNIITLNFYSDNLKKEYERIKNLNICEISEIMFVNITEPYYYFNIYDPEGNTIEICGDYKED